MKQNEARTRFNYLPSPGILSYLYSFFVWTRHMLAIGSLNATQCLHGLLLRLSIYLNLGTNRQPTHTFLVCFDASFSRKIWHNTLVCLFEYSCISSHQEVVFWIALDVVLNFARKKESLFEKRTFNLPGFIRRVYLWFKFLHKISIPAVKGKDAHFKHASHVSFHSRWYCNSVYVRCVIVLPYVPPEITACVFMRPFWHVLMRQPAVCSSRASGSL